MVKATREEIQIVLEAFQHMGATPKQLQLELEKMQVDEAYLMEWMSLISMQKHNDDLELLLL